MRRESDLDSSGMVCESLLVTLRAATTPARSEFHLLLLCVTCLPAQKTWAHAAAIAVVFFFENRCSLGVARRERRCTGGEVDAVQFTGGFCFLCSPRVGNDYGSSCTFV